MDITYISTLTGLKDSSSQHILRHQEGWPQIWYIDPFGDNIPDNLRTILERIYPTAQITPVPLQFQTDHYNCGPWVIEIFRWLMDHPGQLPPEDFNIEAARLEHDRILQHVQGQREESSEPSDPRELSSSHIKFNHIDALMEKLQQSNLTEIEQLLQLLEEQNYDKAKIAEIRRKIALLRKQ